jgi:uncharacterized membrane protein YhaH (DUF805 family)
MTRTDHALTITRHLLDPRGRADRRALFATTVGLLVVQFVLASVYMALGGDVTGNLFVGLNLALLWVGGVVLVKRLHDIGWSGWWILPAVVFWIVGLTLLVLALAFAVGLDRFQTALTTYPLLHALLTAVGALPPFGGLLWLQACPGAPTANRFGTPPAAYGFSVPPAAAHDIDDVSSVATA